MTVNETILILFGVALLIFVGLCVPLFLQIFRTTKEVSCTFQLLNQRLPSILANLDEMTTNLNQTSVTVQRQVDEISMTLKKVQGIVGLFLGIEDVLRRRMRLPVARTLRTSVAIGKGIHVFLNGLLGEKPKEKKGCA